MNRVSKKMTGYSKEELYHDVIECLVAALEAKDAYTKGHSTRVADLALELGKMVGLNGKILEELHLAAHLHDIGKIGIPDRILNKPGPLLSEEFAILKEHPVIGYHILANSKQLKSIAKIVLHHHERWDGTGYPDGLRGETIPYGSRIIGICDAVDAMTSPRPYRKALNRDEWMRELQVNSGKQFDPGLLVFAEENHLFRNI